MKGEITLAIDQIKINSTAYDIGASASNISFNKSGTSLDATNVQSAIVEIDGDINTLDTNKVDKVNGKGLSTNDFADADKTKLNGIETGAQVNTITGVKGSAESTYRVGNVSISKADIDLANVDNTADVNKPISTATQNALNNKVDKVTGKGLSTEDYTTAEKDKLDTVSEYANHVNVTRYGTEGTKIATISCDGINTDIYASGGSGSSGISHYKVTSGRIEGTFAEVLADLTAGKLVCLDVYANGGICATYFRNGIFGIEETSVTALGFYMIYTNKVYEGLLSSDGSFTPSKTYPLPLGYSSTEQNTGIKWIDGKDIYRKTIQFKTANSTDYQHYSTGLKNIEYCNIDFSASGVYVSDTVFVPAGTYAAKDGGSSVEPNCFLLLTNKIDGVLNIDYNVGNNTKDKDAIVTLLYTRT